MHSCLGKIFREASKAEPKEEGEGTIQGRCPTALLHISILSFPNNATSPFFFNNQLIFIIICFICLFVLIPLPSFFLHNHREQGRDNHQSLCIGPLLQSPPNNWLILIKININNIYFLLFVIYYSQANKLTKINKK